jgi:acetyl esterase/lipase
MTRFLLFLLAFAGVSRAAEPFSISLWESTPPGFVADAPVESAQNGITTTNVSVPGMKVYLPEKPNGMAIVYCSGGSYRSVSQSSDWVGNAEFFNAHGIALMVVKYRTAPPSRGYDAALKDAQRAMRLTRHRAKEWRIDPAKIGMLGGSAGAHLILRLIAGPHEGRPDATDVVDRESCRPAFAGLLCPWPAKNTPADFTIQKTTPPVFLASAKDDTIAPTAFAQGIADAFQEAGVPATLWTIEKGGHPAFRIDSKAEGGQWAERFIRWLDTLR